MRWLPLLLCLVLAGCMTDETAHDVVPSSAQASAPRSGKPADAQKDARSDSKSDKKGDAKSSDAKSGKDDDWWKQGGVTREKVSAMCWMKYEHGRKDMPLDQRADLVNQCVADTMKANPPSAGLLR